VPVYWTVLTLGPAAIVITAIIDGRVDAFVADTLSWGWALRIAPVLWSHWRTATSPRRF